MAVALNYDKQAFGAIHQNQCETLFSDRGANCSHCLISDQRIARGGRVKTAFLVISATATSMREIVTSSRPEVKMTDQRGIKGSFIRKPFKEFSIRQKMESQKGSIDVKLIREPSALLQHQKRSQQIRRVFQGW